MNAGHLKLLDEDEAGALVESSPFADAFTPDSPLLILRARPEAIVYANPAALKLFKAGDGRQLAHHALGSTSAGAQRLAALASETAHDHGPRVEWLRFLANGEPLQIALNCARVNDAAGEHFLMALGLPDEIGADLPALAHDRNAKSAAASVEASDKDKGSERMYAERPAPLRFVWSLDREQRFLPPLLELTAHLSDNAPRAGETLLELSRRTGFDAAGALAEAVASEKTFTSLGLDWPLPDGRSRRLHFSGVPQWNGEMRFSGYRGFGIVSAAIQEPIARASDSHNSDTARHGEAPLGLAGIAPSVEEAPAPPQAGQAADVKENEIEPPTPRKAPQAKRDAKASPRSAEVVPLRPQAQTSGGAANVVPLRPTPARAAAPATEMPARGSNGSQLVELTSGERDAFREIARALGAKIRPAAQTAERVVEEPAAEAPATETASHAPRDILDLGATPRPPGLAPETHAPQHSPKQDAAMDAPGRNALELLDRLPIGAMVTRGDEALYLNRTLLDLLGYADAEAFRRAKGLSHMFRGREPEVFANAGGALPIVDAHGEVIAVDGQIQTVQWDRAQATLISLRRALEPAYRAKLRGLERDAELLQSAARDHVALMDIASDGAMTLNKDGRILSLNSAAEAHFGYNQREVAGEDFRMLLAPLCHTAALAAFERVRDAPANDKPVDIELVSLRRDGREKLVNMRIGAMAGSGEAKYGAALHERATARVKPDRLNALQSNFLAQTSHEIRTPLHAILGFTEVMIEERFGPLGNKRYKDYLKDIHASGEHVLSLVNDLLDLSKIEAGKLDLEFTALDANRLIRECVALMQPQAERERVIMRVALSDPLPKIMADERSIRQILLNLMSNAVKFNEPGGQVIVSTVIASSGQAIIRVRDTGVGMNENEIGAALQPFSRVGDKGRTSGTGLGLPLTKALVEANKAAFSIQSRREQGTLIELAFPVIPVAAQ